MLGPFIVACLAVLTFAAACTPAGAGGAPGAPANQQAPKYAGWPGSGAAVGSGDLVPIVVSSELAVGPNRFLFTLVDKQNKLLAAPDVTTDVAFFDLQSDPASPVERGKGRFIWSIVGERGLYATSTTFARAGDWGVEVTAHQPSAADRSARVVFSVRDKLLTPAIGSLAPAAETPTATTASEVARISTDKSPDLDFYRVSLSDAVASGRPTVLIFATPLFCQTQTCGPVLDAVKHLAAPYKRSVTFVHVEPYELRLEGTQLQPKLDASGNPVPVAAVERWGLVTEPYTAVIDRDGRVSAKFEGVVAEDELKAAIDSVVR